jgi:class 3 adenylate cyclase
MAQIGDPSTAHVDVSALSPFVSELALEWDLTTPGTTTQQVFGTLVFADVSGFTKLTERLAANGRFGAEEISDHLDLVLSGLLDAAYRLGGRLIKWGGDALLLIYDGHDHARRACAGAAAMRATMAEIGLLQTSVGRVRLRMSVGVHTGRFDLTLVGSVHRELLITGRSATVTARLEATAEAGEILVSQQTAARLPEHCRGSAKGDGILLARTPAHDDPAARTLPAVDPTGLMPELVLAHLRAGGGSGEHRPVAIGFLEFGGLSRRVGRGGRDSLADALAHVVETAQEACKRYGVSFHETDISPDGGKIMLVAGAPHGLDDPAEAMLCAVREVLDDPGSLTLRAGVTVGRVFSGCVGPAYRRSYSVKGDVVNLAARIMG